MILPTNTFALKEDEISSIDPIPHNSDGTASANTSVSGSPGFLAEKSNDQRSWISTPHNIIEFLVGRT